MHKKQQNLYIFLKFKTYLKEALIKEEEITQEVDKYITDEHFVLMCKYFDAQNEVKIAREMLHKIEDDLKA